MKGLRRRAVAAVRRSWGQPDSGSAGKGGSSPDDGETDRHHRTIRARLASEKGVTKVNQWLNPLKRGTDSNLMDVGRLAAHVDRVDYDQRLRSRFSAVGGEATRKACGVLVAMLQGKSWTPTLTMDAW